MDHMDWCDEAYSKQLATALSQHIVPGGRVIWRSAAIEPPYAHIIAAAGFKVLRILQMNSVQERHF